MFLTVEKLEKRTRELEAFRFRDMRTILPMAALDDQAGPDEVHNHIPPELDEVREAAVRQGDYFVGRDQYLWLRRQVVIPPGWEGHQVYGLFNFGKTGPGNTEGFEALLYVNGHPYQGVDTYHPDVCLDQLAGQSAQLTFLLWSGLEGGGKPREQVHMIQQADLGYLHQDTDAFYYYAKAIYKTVKLLAEEDTNRSFLIGAMEKALRLINWDEDKFYDTISGALDCLRTALAARPKVSDVTVHCIGHTHIDMAWLWRLKHTREKGMRSFSTVLRLMEEFDEYIFLQSQPQLYQYIKSDCPELYEAIRKRVAEGRWEPEGGMWLEADCNLSSGESLVRQFLHGIRFIRQEFGRECTCLWLPDVFGYSWALPQIMKQCGIKTFMTTKISWNQYNSIPNDLFFWRGLDGSEILTYFITTPEVGQDFDCRFSTYNGLLSPRTVLGSWKKFKNKAITQDILLAYGFGDGGGGVNRNMLKMRRAMDELPGLPHVVTDTAGDFFDKIHRDVENADSYVATWDGELYLEYHRGTYTTQAANKKWNRRLEYRLTETEWLSSLSLLAGGRYAEEALHECWETVLRNQFHDIIPGSSIREVYEDSEREYRQADRKLEEVRREALAVLTRPDDTACVVINPGSFRRRGLAVLPAAETGRFLDETGRVLPAQRTAGGYLVETEAAALSLQTLYFEPGKEAETETAFAVDMDAHTLESPLYSLAWTEQGALCRLYDKENKREVLTPGGFGNVLEIYEDKPLNFDAWDIDRFYTQKKEIVPARSAVRIETGPLQAMIRFTYVYNQSLIIQDMILYAHSRRIDFRTTVDWHEAHRLLKVSFDTAIRSVKATYDIQFGHVERPTHYNTSWDAARFEVVGHKWADLSDSRYGVSLLNDSKYGYSIKDHVMKLSLLKSSKYPDPQADMGGHAFTYALLPHAGAVADGDTIEESVSLNQPLEVEAGVHAAAAPLLRCDSEDVHIDAVKRSEEGDCLVVRFHECRGAAAVCRLMPGRSWKKWAVCNLLEETQGEESTAPVIEAALHPFEIRTYKIWMEEGV